MKINIDSVKTARSTISSIGKLLDTSLSQVYIGDKSNDDVKNRAYNIRNRLRVSRDNCNSIISKIDSFINDYDEASKNVLELLKDFSVNTFGSFSNNLGVDSNEYTNNIDSSDNDNLSDEEAASLVRLSSNLSNLSSDTLEDKINSLDISSDDKQYLIEQYGKGNERAGDLRLMEIVLEKELENEKNNLSNLEVELDNKEKEKSSLFSSLYNKYFNSSSYNNIGREGDIKTSDAQNKAHNDSDYLSLETEYNELKSKRDDSKQYISSLESQIKQYKQKRLEYEYDYMLDIDADKTNYNFEGDSSYWTEDEKYSNMIVFEGFSSEILRYYINFYENNPDAIPRTNPEFYLSYAALFMYRSGSNDSKEWIVPMDFGNDISDPDCFQIYTEKRIEFNNDLLDNANLSDISSVKQYVADNYNSDDLYVKDLLTYIDENSNVDLKKYLENDNIDYTSYSSLLDNCKISVPENQKYDYAYETGLTYNNTMAFSRALLKLQVEGKIPDTVFNYRDDYQDGLSIKTYFDSNSILFSNLKSIDHFGDAALLFDDSQMNVFYYLLTHEGIDAAQNYLNVFDYETSRSFFNERSGYYKAEEMFYKIVNATDSSFIEGLISSDIQGFKLGFENYFDSVETLFDKYGTMTDSEYAIMYLNSMLGSMSYFIPLSASDIEGMANEGLIDSKSDDYVDLYVKANNGLRVTYLDILHANGSIDDISYQSFSELGNDQKIKDFIDRNNTDGGFLGYNRLEWLQHFVNIGQSAGYMAPSLITSMYLGAAGVGENLSQAAGLAVMFLGCMSSSKNQALREGTSLGMAYLYGLLSGGSEVLTEYAIGGLTGLSRLSKYFNVPGITKSRTVGRLLLQYFVLGNLEECAEELVQGAILSPLIDYSILGKEYSFTLEEAKDTIATTWISTMQMNLASTIITAPSTIKKSGYAATIKLSDGVDVKLTYNELLQCLDKNENIDSYKLSNIVQSKVTELSEAGAFSDYWNKIRESGQIFTDKVEDLTNSIKQKVETKTSSNNTDIEIDLTGNISTYWDRIRESGKIFSDNVDVSFDGSFHNIINKILSTKMNDSVVEGLLNVIDRNHSFVDIEYLNDFITLKNDGSLKFDNNRFLSKIYEDCFEFMKSNSVDSVDYKAADSILSFILNNYKVDDKAFQYDTFLKTIELIKSNDTDGKYSDLINVLNSISKDIYPDRISMRNFIGIKDAKETYTLGINLDRLVFNIMHYNVSNKELFLNLFKFNDILNSERMKCAIDSLYFTNFVMNNLTDNSNNNILRDFLCEYNAVFRLSDIEPYLKNNTFDYIGFLEHAFYEGKLRDSNDVEKLLKFDFINEAMNADEFDIAVDIVKYIDQLKVFSRMFSLSETDMFEFNKIALLTRCFLLNDNIRENNRDSLEVMCQLLSDIYSNLMTYGTRSFSNIDGVNCTIYGSFEFIDRARKTLTLLVRKLPNIYKLAFQNINQLVVSEHSAPHNLKSSFAYYDYCFKKNTRLFQSSGTYNSSSDNINLWNFDKYNITDLFETLLHELGHKIDNDFSKWSFARFTRGGNDWGYAIAYDKYFVSDYGKTNREEDYAEFSRIFGVLFSKKIEMFGSSGDIITDIENFNDDNLRYKYSNRFRIFKDSLIRYYKYYSIKNTFSNDILNINQHSDVSEQLSDNFTV